MIVATILVLLLSFAAPVSASESYGEVSFANSGAPAAQADFLQAMALLHDFEYDAAAQAFRRAQEADPAFALAYWGEAMTYNHPIWMRQDRAAAHVALGRLAGTASARRVLAPTEREKLYLDAVETLYDAAGTKDERDFLYEAAMARLHERFPDDVDATALYGLSILGTAHAGRDPAIYMRAAGVLEGAWFEHREHPGLLHYLIHSYDDPTHAPLGLRMARRYAAAAPDAGHANHMTSHIFLALGMWRETVDTNLAAIAAVDRVRAEEKRGRLRCGHYPSWLEYAYLQLGEMESARATLVSCREAALEELASGEPGHAMDPDRTLGGSFASMRLAYLLASGDWNGEIANWALPPVAGPGARLDFAFARALAAISTSSTSARTAAAGASGASEIELAFADLEAVSREVISIETVKQDPNPTYRVRPEILLGQARALLAEKNGKSSEAEQLLRQTVALEDSLPVAFGPPAVDKPTHELLGEFLLRNNRRDEARAEFARALALAPGRRLAGSGLAAASVPER